MATAIEAPKFVEPLKELCIKAVAHNFENSPDFSALPPKCVREVIELLPLDLPLELAGTLLHDEDYWCRKSTVRWKNCDPAPHGGSWKQLYFERNLESTLEEFDPEVDDIHDLRRLLTYSRRFVRSLVLRQLPSHLDLQLISESLGNSLTRLALTYGLRQVGMDYDRSLFGMKLSDCRSLARALERTETLTYLDLSSNLLDDDKVRMIASGLVDNVSVTELNLSHNKLADRGVRALAKLFDHRNVMAIVDLNDNQIHSEGGRALARALRANKSLTSIDLGLNRLGEDGGRAILDVLRYNTSMDRVNLAANALGPTCAHSLSNLIRHNNTLRHMDVSCNAFGEESGELIRDAITENKGLQVLDLRLSQLGPDEEIAISDELAQRAELAEKDRILNS